MKAILVTGMSGVGKSAALSELRRRGYLTVDTDEPGWTEWSDADGGYLWREQRLDELLSADRETTLYISGTVSNQGRFYPLFDAVVLLSVPTEVMLQRIATRTTNDYGKHSAEREEVLRNLAEVEPQLRATCTHEVDASLPLDQVVDVLIDIGS
jgi:thymidylate kinase